MSLISLMKAAPARGFIPGKCPAPACGRDVFESLTRLDDCYNVWVGKCPHCGAHAFLGLNSLRGYNADGMDLWLPTDEERDSNGLPADIPTRGPAKNKGPMLHGTVAGELMHQLRQEQRGISSISISIVICVLSILVAISVAAPKCHAKWGRSGLKASWGPLQGCLVQLQDGRWIPEDRVREIDIKPAEPKVGLHLLTLAEVSQ